MAYTRAEVQFLLAYIHSETFLSLRGKPPFCLIIGYGREGEEKIPNWKARVGLHVNTIPIIVF